MKESIIFLQKKERRKERVACTQVLCILGSFFSHFAPSLPDLHRIRNTNQIVKFVEYIQFVLNHSQTFIEYWNTNQNCKTHYLQNIYVVCLELRVRIKQKILNVKQKILKENKELKFKEEHIEENIDNKKWLPYDYEDMFVKNIISFLIECKY